MKNEDMTPNDFRELALDVAGAIEQSHMNHPDFRLNGKIFASLGAPGEEWGMVKLAPEEQKEFIRTYRRTFEPSAGAWGRQGCTNVRLATVEPVTLRAALLLAWEKTAATPPRRTASRTMKRRSKTHR